MALHDSEKQQHRSHHRALGSEVAASVSKPEVWATARAEDCNLLGSFLKEEWLELDYKK